MWTSSITATAFIYVLFSVVQAKPIDEKAVSDRPLYKEYAKIARYLVHRSNWTAMGTISTLSQIKGYPMVNVKSVADSALNAKSTGHIYLMLTDLDLTARDLNVNNKVTALFTENQDLTCTLNNIDPIDPICARAIFVGKIRKLEKNSKEFDDASEWFLSRHPAARDWYVNGLHGFYFCELDIEYITVVSFYGGAETVSVEDYFNANYDQMTNEIARV